MFTPLDDSYERNTKLLLAAMQVQDADLFKHGKIAVSLRS